MTQTQVNGNTGAMAKKAPTVMDMIVQKLSSDSVKRQFATACPTHLKVNAERYVRQFCTQIRLNPKLAECEPSSLFGAMMTGTALGLDPSPSLGEFYIIPYENQKRGIVEAQFQLGYKGMVALAYRGGVRRFQAHTIYANDHFDYSLGANPRLEHKPNLVEDRGKPIAYYAIAELPSGETVFEIMGRVDVEAHGKRYSKAYNTGPWKTEFDEMAKKTVAKSLFKWIPKSTELAVAVSKDGAIARVDENIRSSEDVLDADVSYEEPEDMGTPNDALAAEILSSAQPATQAPIPAAPIEPEMSPLDGTPAEAPQAAPIQSAREADPQIDFAAEKGIGPDPTQSQEQKIKTPPDPETEKLRTELKGLLAINLNDAEAEEWIRQNFGAAKAAKGLTKADLKAAIVQINAELDARETEI